VRLAPRLQREREQPVHPRHDGVYPTEELLCRASAVQRSRSRVTFVILPATPCPVPSKNRQRFILESFQTVEKRSDPLASHMV
jgi:hypothetical protein